MMFSKTELSLHNKDKHKDEETIRTQYNSFATTYSDVFIENNQNSIAAYFKHFDFSLEGKKILDLGCGDGHDLYQMKLKGAVIFGVDSSSEMIHLAEQKNPDGTFKLGYFDRIPFEANFFDLVVSKWAFQTASNIDPIYEEIARVLKTNGQLIYLTSHPIRQFIEKKHPGKDYFKKEIVESSFFDGKITVKEPSHTMNEYLSPAFFNYFSLSSYEEGYDAGAEKVDGDTYPSYFILKCHRK